MAIIDETKLPSESSPEYTSNSLDHYGRLRSIDSNTSEGEIFDILKSSYPVLLSEDVVKKNKDLARHLFTNDKVLLMLDKLLANTVISQEQRVYLNKIIYSMIINNAATSEYAYSLLMSIAKNNNPEANTLAAYLPTNVATALAVMRNSSFKEMNNVRRTNDFMLHSVSLNDNTEQTIVNIYDTLFRSVTSLFEGIMIDVKDQSSLTETEREIYGIQGLAILDIIEQMPIQYIEKVLGNYYGDLHMTYLDCPTRFSLLSIAACDYPRITEVNRRISAVGSYMPNR